MTKLRFDGKVAIVTGAGRGLGRDYALMLASRGARVVVNDFACQPDGSASDETPAEAVVREIRDAGGDAIADRHSVTDDASAIVAAAVEKYGRLDILINNAGISGGGWFAEIPPASWDLMVDTHLGGTVAMSRAAWSHLSAGKGRIINMSSTASFGAPFTSHYSTAKAAMIGLTRTLAAEGAASGMTVNAIMPSAYTRLTAQIPDPVLRDHLADEFQPVRVAAFVVWLAHASTAVNGEIFSVGGRRAARVVLAEGPGGIVSEDTPEAWASEQAKVMSLDPMRAPLSMVEELCDTLESLGPSGAAVAGQIRQTHAWKP